MGTPLRNQRDEYLRLLVEVQGAQAIPLLEQDLTNLGREVENLKSLQQLAAISGDQLTSELQRISRESVTTAGYLASLKGSKGISGQGILGLSFAIQDITAANGDFLRALYNVQNNIPVVLYQLGLGTGLAGTISLVSLGIGLLLPRLIDLGKSLFETGDQAIGFRDKLKALEEQAKKLEKIDIKTNIEARDLEILRGQIDEIKKGIEAVKRLRDELPATQKEAGQEFVKTFAELAPGGPRSAINQIIGQTYLQAKAAAEAPGGAISDIEAKIIQAEANAAASAASGERGGAAMAREFRNQAAALRKQIPLMYRALREEAERTVNREVAGAERGETPMIEAFAGRAERLGMRPLGTALRAATPEAMTAAREEEAEFQRGIEDRKEAIARRAENRRARKQAAREAEKAEGQASDEEAHEFQRGIDDRKFQIDLRNLRRREQRKKQRENETKARKEASEIQHATTIDEQLQAAALMGRPRASVLRELRRAHPGISEGTAEELLNRADERARSLTMEAGGDPREAHRRLAESQQRKSEKQQADYMEAQVKKAVRAGAYGPEAAQLPENTLDNAVKHIVAQVQHGQNVDVAALQTLHQAVSTMERLMMNDQALLYGYSDLTTRMFYIQQMLQQQDSYLRNPMNGAQQQQLGWGM